jgi:membrane-associated phospholipid phosphatase
MNRSSIHASVLTPGGAPTSARNGGQPPPVRAVHVVHTAVPGRLRLSIAGLKRNPTLARRLDNEAARWAGVHRATASPITGTLLLQFAPAATDAGSLIARVEAAAASTPAPRVRPREASGGAAATRALKQAVAALEAAPVPPPAPPRARALEAALGGAALLGAGALLLAVRAHGHRLAIDQAPLAWATEIHSPALTAFMRGLSRLVDPIAVVPVTAGAAALGVGKRRPQEMPWLAPVAVAGGEAVVLGLKALLRRARPTAFAHRTWTFGSSLPSGHAFVALCLYGLLAYHGLRWLRARRPGDRRAAALLVVVAGTVVLAVGVSRVYLGVHYPTDVLAGYALALLWLWLLAALRRLPEPFPAGVL